MVSGDLGRSQGAIANGMARRRELRLGPAVDGPVSLLAPGWGSWLGRHLPLAHCDGGGAAVPSPALPRDGPGDKCEHTRAIPRTKSQIQRRASKRYVPKPISVHVGIGHDPEQIVSNDAKGGGADHGGLNPQRSESDTNDQSHRLDSPQTTLESLQHGAWAGGVAGVIADTLMHPFDTISMRLKCQLVERGGRAKYSGVTGTARVMLQEEGFRSLFNGVSATILCAVPSSAIYFGTYELVKSLGLEQAERLSGNGGLLSSVDIQYQADAVHLFAGVSSELAASVVVVPFEVVKSRMQMGGSPYHGALHGLISIARGEGAAGLFAGYRACLSLDCSFSAIQFFLYERLKQNIKEDRRRNEAATTSVEEQTLEELVDSIEDTAEDLVAGALSGGLGAFLTNPLDVASARLMTQDYTPGNEAQRRYGGTLDCLSKVARNEGLRGLFSGSLARVLSIAPLSAITFGVYEKMRAFLRSA